MEKQNWVRHYNFLIGLDGIEPATPENLANMLQSPWVGGMNPMGTAVIELFRKELHLNGIHYQSKYEFETQGNPLNNPELFFFILWKHLTETATSNA
jgi:hypothetical protein